MAIQRECLLATLETVQHLLYTEKKLCLYNMTHLELLINWHLKMGPVETPLRLATSPNNHLFARVIVDCRTMQRDRRFVEGKTQLWDLKQLESSWKKKHLRTQDSFPCCFTTKCYLWHVKRSSKVPDCTNCTTGQWYNTLVLLCVNWKRGRALVCSLTGCSLCHPSMSLCSAAGVSAEDAVIICKLCSVFCCFMISFPWVSTLIILK